jgi:hypothetical protein
MTWELRRKRSARRLASDQAASFAVRTAPKVRTVKPIEPIRPPKPIPPAGYEYYWKPHS